MSNLAPRLHNVGPLRLAKLGGRIFDLRRTGPRGISPRPVTMERQGDYCLISTGEERFWLSVAQVMAYPYRESQDIPEVGDRVTAWEAKGYPNLQPGEVGEVTGHPSTHTVRVKCPDGRLFTFHVGALRLDQSPPQEQN